MHNNSIPNRSLELSSVTEENVSLKTEITRLTDDLTLARRNALAAEDEHRQRTEELESRLSALVTTENELRERAMESEVTYSDRLKAGEQRERELQERLQRMEENFEVMRLRAETRENELQKKLESQQEEAEVILRSQSLSESHRESSMSVAATPKQPSYRHSSPCKSMSDTWQDEAESLRSVLDLKLSEIAELRRQNEEMRRSSDELIRQQIRTSSLESKVEDLQFQLNGRIERER